VNGRSANLLRQQRFVLSIVIFNFLLIGGCGAPGEPQPPSPPIPSTVNDLAAHQQGNGVQLVFTLPSRTLASEKLTEPPAIEIFRGSLKSNGSPDDKSFKLVYTSQAHWPTPTRRREKFNSPIHFRRKICGPLGLYTPIAFEPALPRKKLPPIPTR
jgi:hypothetical protein